VSLALHAFTYDDLADTPDDGNRYEIINGELLVSPSPSVKHQRLVGRLFVEFTGFVTANDLGEVFVAPLDVIFSPYNVVQPDLFFLSRSRLPGMAARVITGAPDLAVEILSPHSRLIDLVRKKALYATAGVQEYWAVDSRHRAISVFTLVNDQYEPGEASDGFARSLVLAGFQVDVAELFAELAADED
jgi:Uma2 family endonuclease